MQNDGGNSDILGMTVETLAPMRRAFELSGYAMIPVAKAEGENWAEVLLRNSTERLGGTLTDEAGFRKRIMESIAHQKRPVIAFGIIVPPEAAVITGYDERGDVLIGWNVFQGKTETELSGYFRISDWYDSTRGLLLFGGEVDIPDPSGLDRDVLLWALRILRSEGSGDGLRGGPAFEAWASDMSDDAFFPQGNEKVLNGSLVSHYDAMQMQAERKAGTDFLIAAAEREQAMAEHLLAASQVLMEGGVKHGVEPNERDQIARLADADIRREVSQSILETWDAYQKTADHLEKALLAAGIPPEVSAATTGYVSIKAAATNPADVLKYE